MKILIITGDGKLSHDLKKRLDAMGCGISGIASTAEEGLMWARQVRPDVILLDVMLKGDLEVMEASRIFRYRMRVPVIFITGFGETTVFHLMKKLVPGCYLSKPVKNSELRRALRRVREDDSSWHVSPVLGREVEFPLLAN